MKKENGIINLGAMSILFVSTLMISLGVLVYTNTTNTVTGSLQNNVRNNTTYFSNNTNYTFDNYTFNDESDDELDYDLDDYSNYSDYSFGNFTEE